MKTHDTDGRRLPYSGIPDGRKHYRKPRDIEWYYFLLKHGGILPTSFLHACTIETHRDRLSSVRRLDTLANSLKTITRIKANLRTENPWSDEILHSLNENSRSILEISGKNLDFAPTTKLPLEHHLANFGITASFDLNCRGTDIAFEAQNEFLTTEPIFTIDGKKLIPDGMFRLSRDIGKMLCMLETDRGTEPSVSTQFRKSTKSMLEQYKQLHDFIDGKRLYQEQLGITDDMFLLFVTASEAKRRATLKIVQELYPNGCAYILTHVIPEIHPLSFKMPRPMDMLSVKWERVHAKPVFSFI